MYYPIRKKESNDHFVQGDRSCDKIVLYIQYEKIRIYIYM